MERGGGLGGGGVGSGCNSKESEIIIGLELVLHTFNRNTETTINSHFNNFEKGRQWA